MVKSLLVAVLTLVIASVAPLAAEEPLPATSLEDQVEALFAPGRDLLDVKLSVDALLEPSTRIEDGAALINELAAALLPMTAGISSSSERLQILRRFLYQSGQWNEYRPFTYDMADPLGKNPANKLLARYIRTRLGNCVTMPVLAVILGRRLGLKMTLALAPLHVFIKYTDDTGGVWNLEATSGLGFTRDLWYRKELPMSNKAIANGVYLRPLTEEENVGLVATLLIEHEMLSRRPENAIAATNAIVRHNPRDAIAHVWRGSAYALMLRRDIVGAYPDLASLPPEVRAYADALYMSNQADFAAAEALGWTEQDGMKPDGAINE